MIVNHQFPTLSKLKRFQMTSPIPQNFQSIIQEFLRLTGLDESFHVEIFEKAMNSGRGVHVSLVKEFSEIELARSSMDISRHMDEIISPLVESVRKSPLVQAEVENYQDEIKRSTESMDKLRRSVANLTKYKNHYDLELIANGYDLGATQTAEVV